MKTHWVLLLVVLAVGVGFAGSLLLCRCPDTGVPAGGVEDAKAALDALVRHTKQGAGAVREALELVDRIVAGGPEMIEPLERALADAAHWEYRGPPWAMDPRACAISTFPTRKIALLEATARIGGDRAREILEKAATARNVRPWIDKVAPLLFLARRADEAQVRTFLTGVAAQKLKTQRKDAEMLQAMRIVRGRVDASLFPYAAGAIETGWPGTGLATELAHVLYTIDTEKSRAFFTRALESGLMPVSARRIAAFALGRIPEARADAAARALGLAGQPEILAWFVQGLRAARFGEGEMLAAARDGGDLEAFRAYRDGRLRDMEDCLGLLREIEAKVGGTPAKKLGLPAAREDLDGQRKHLDQTLEELEKQVGALKDL